MALMNEALPAAHAAVRVQERNVTIANLQGEIAATDLAYARDLVIYQNERFLNRDFWDALAGVARRSLHRYLDLAGQAGWFAERALAYRLATPIRVIRIGYFDPQDARCRWRRSVGAGPRRARGTATRCGPRDRPARAHLFAGPGPAAGLRAIEGHRPLHLHPDRRRPARRPSGHVRAPDPGARRGRRPPGHGGAGPRHPDQQWLLAAPARARGDKGAAAPVRRRVPGERVPAPERPGALRPARRAVAALRGCRLHHHLDPRASPDC